MCKFNTNIHLTSHHSIGLRFEIQDVSISRKMVLCVVIIFAANKVFFSDASFSPFLLSHFFFQVLVFLFFLCVNDYLSALLYAQVRSSTHGHTVFK